MSKQVRIKVISVNIKKYFSDVSYSNHFCWDEYLEAVFVVFSINKINSWLDECQ